MGKLHLQDYLRMGIGDGMQGISNSKSVLEDLFESIIGAVYLDTDRNLFCLFAITSISLLA